MCRGLLGADDATRGAHDERRRPVRLLTSAPRARGSTGRRVARGRRRRRRRRPLVLSELRCDLVRRDDVRFREAPPKLAGDRRLVGRITEGEQCADSHPPRPPDPAASRGSSGTSTPSGPSARKRHDSRRARRAAPDARRRAGRDERGSAAADGAGARSRPWPRTPCVRPCVRGGVRRDRRAVREALDAACPHGGRRGEHGLLLCPSRRHLCGHEPVAVEQHGVGERPADVDAEDRHAATLLRARPR